MNELSTVSAKWEKLGEQLGMDYDYLKEVRTQYSNPADSMRELIKRWLKQDYQPFGRKGLTTWNHIVLALKSPNVGESQLGDHLKQKYLPGELFYTFTIHSPFNGIAQSLAVMAITINRYRVDHCEALGCLEECSLGEWLGTMVANCAPTGTIYTNYIKRASNHNYTPFQECNAICLLHHMCSKAICDYNQYYN